MLYFFTDYSGNVFRDAITIRRSFYMYLSLLKEGKTTPSDNQTQIQDCFQSVRNEVQKLPSYCNILKQLWLQYISQTKRSFQALRQSADHESYIRQIYRRMGAPNILSPKLKGWRRIFWPFNLLAELKQSDALQLLKEIVLQINGGRADIRLAHTAERLVVAIYTQVQPLCFSWWVFLFGLNTQVMALKKYLDHTYKAVLQVKYYSPHCSWMKYARAIPVASKVFVERLILEQGDVQPSYLVDAWKCSDEASLKAAAESWWANYLYDKLLQCNQLSERKLIQRDINLASETLKNQIADRIANSIAQEVKRNGCEMFFSSNWVKWTRDLHQYAAPFYFLECEKWSRYQACLTLIDEQSCNAFMWYRQREKNGLAGLYHHAMAELGFTFIAR